MYTPELAPIAHSLLWSSLVAILPLLTVFVTLGVLKWKAHWAGLAGLAVSLIVAVVGLRNAGQPGRTVGHRGVRVRPLPDHVDRPERHLVVRTDRRQWTFRGSATASSTGSRDDPRVQAVIIAFCFGGLLEALAGFGAPVAITGVMLMSVGFTPMRAAVVVLVSNTAPVAFGAIATPIITAGTLTGIHYTEIGAVVGRQTPLLALFVPLILIFLADGRRGLREVWPVALVVGVVFAVMQFISANFLSVELTDVIASLAGLAAAVLMLRVWQPSGTAASRERMLRERESDRDGEPAGGVPAAASGGVALKSETDTELTPGRVTLALFPYLLVIVVFALAKLWTPVKNWLAGTDTKFGWPGLDGNILTSSGKPSSSTVYTFGWLSTPGSLLLLSGIVVAIVYRMSLVEAARVYGRTFMKMRYSILTVAAVLALAYVMNQSGQTITIGSWIAGTGALFAFLSPILGWLGTAVTGSDTSANALFATLQQAAAQKAGIDPTLLVAANTSGGVVGKMISPQNLTIAATAVGLLGRESDIFRRALWWSVGLLAVLCLLVGLQSTVLSWMLP